MQYFYILGVFESLFLFVFLLSKKGRSVAECILAVAFLVFGLNILVASLEWVNRTSGYPFPFLIQTTPLLVLLQGPLLWLYIKAQTTQHFRFRPIYLLHLLSFFILLVGLYVYFYSLPVNERIFLDKTEGFKSLFSYKVSRALMIFSTTMYCVWNYILIVQYQKRIKNYFSEIKKINLDWLKLVIVSTFIVSSVANIAFVLDSFYKTGLFHVIQSISFALFSLLMLFLGFWGHYQVALITTVSIDDLYEKQVSVLKVSQVDEIFISKLLSVMDIRKPYLDQNLTLSVLSVQLQVSEDYLSMILNNRLERNFYDFINQYRVDEFKARCQSSSNDNLTFSALAFECGFNSKATFNRVFKKSTGLTPSEFKKSLN